MLPNTAMTFVVFLASIIAYTQAHMHLNHPPPFNSSNNPYTTTNPDPYLDYPYDCCGPNDRWTYPCRGYTALLGTPAGAPTATWAVGSTQTWNMYGIGNHYGGSCQVGFSVDGGKTFRVATSYEGDCPHRNGGLMAAGQNFETVVPSDMPVGVAVFAWIWYNREQEFNMNCAAVNITAEGDGNFPTSSAVAPNSASTAVIGGGNGSATVSTATTVPSEAAGPLYTTVNNCICACDSAVEIESCSCTCPANSPIHRRSPQESKNSPCNNHHHAHIKHDKRSSTSPSAAFTAFTDRPEMLIADDGNGCLTPKTTAELKYPNPGPDVVLGDGMYPLELPSGTCADIGVQAYDGQTGEDGHAV